MAIKFYLHQIDDQHEIHCNTNSTFTEVAGALDLGTMELEWNECKNAIFPNTPFFIKETTSNRVWSFVISQDDVEVISKNNPIKYLHRLTLSQSIHKINNVPLRNTVFSQPYNIDKSFIKPSLFVSGKKYTSGHYDFNRYMYFEEFRNAKDYEKVAYPIDLRGINNISQGSFHITSVMNIFDGISRSPGYQSWSITNLTKKYVNRKISQLNIQFINANDPNDILEKYLSYEQLVYKNNTFTQNELNWFKNKKVFIHVPLGLLNQDIASDLPNLTSWGSFVPPSLLGIVTVHLDLHIYNYSLWDVLDILNKQCRKQYNNNQLTSFYTMPSKTDGGHGQLLAETMAPEFNFTQMDLYEAVAKVLSFIDAFPVLKEDGTLDFQYLNDLSEETIGVLRKADDKMTLNETNFTNKLGSYYQNGKLNYPITYPAKNRCVRPTSSNYGVPSRNNWYYYVQKPIDYIDKITIRIPNTRNFIANLMYQNTAFYDPFEQGGAAYASMQFSGISVSYNETLGTTTDIDITPFVLRSDFYNELSYGSARSGSLNRNNTLYYNHGDNRIYCGITGEISTSDSAEYDVLQFVLLNGLLYSCGYGVVEKPHLGTPIEFTYNLEDKTKFAFNVVYHPILDGKVSEESTINKVEKETIVAQANSSSQLNRLGNNLQGLIAKLGNEEHAITLPITDLSQKISLGTKYIDELGNSWIANKIQTTFTTSESKVLVNVTFTKNFNAMAQFTSLNQEKRFYQISEALTNKGYENINEFIYFTHRAGWHGGKSAEQAEPIAVNYIGIDSIIAKTLGHLRDTLQDRVSVCDYALIKPVRASENTGIQPIVYGLGNQICFEFSFDNSISAGRYTDTNNDNTKTWTYTASDGIANYINIECRFTSILTWNHILENYPKFTATDGVTFLKINQFYYYKKPNEIFHTNYSICFLPYWTKTVDALGTPLYHYEEIFFGDKFINENGIIPNTDYENGKERRFTLWVSNEKYSIIDNKVLDSAIKVTGTITPGVYHEHTDQGNSGCITHGAIDIQVNGSAFELGNYKSWALADEDKNIYIAVNREFNEEGESLSQPYPRLWFFTSRYRKI